MSKYVAQSPTRREIYHVDKHCKRLKNEPLAKPEAYVEWHDMDSCDYCDGDKD